MKPQVLLLQLLIKALDFVQAFIPAALVAWNDYLRRQNATLAAKLATQTAETEIAKQTAEIDAHYDLPDRRARLDMLLARGREGASQPPQKLPPE